MTKYFFLNVIIIILFFCKNVLLYITRSVALKCENTILRRVVNVAARKIIPAFYSKVNMYLTLYTHRYI